MARSRALADLRDDVCLAADVKDGGATGRHTTTAINRRINQAIQYFTRLVTEAGSDWYIAQVSGTTGTSATADSAGWAPRDYIPMPDDFYHLKGIDISNGSTTVSMRDFMELERNRSRDAPWWLNISNPGVGVPRYYKLGGLNQNSKRVAKVIPSSDGSYAYTVWYLPVPPDLVNDTDEFDFIAGYEDWVVNRAALDLLKRDGATQPTYATLAAENDKIEQEMRFNFACAQGAGRRVDSLLLGPEMRIMPPGGGGSGGGGSVTLFHVYHGAALAVVTETDIKALAVDVQVPTRVVPNYPATALGLNYEWFCLPSSLGTPTFTDATTNFGIPFDNMGTVSVTNSSGTAPYVVWRSHFPAIGTSGTVVVKVT